MKVAFRKAKLSKQNKERLHMINSIIREYQEDGYTLTLRQLYYQLVSRDVIPNKQAEYSKLSKLLKEGRMSGVVDWDAIEDRLRKIKKNPTWDSPKSILMSAIRQYQKDRHRGQSKYLEVWVEKDALSQVVSRSASKYQVGVLVNRGYGSVSAMYDAYQRYEQEIKEGKQVVILYLGDHDPSGIDMIRDIQERIQFMVVNSGDMDWIIESWQEDYEITYDDVANHKPEWKEYSQLPYMDSGAAYQRLHAKFDTDVKQMYLEVKELFKVIPIALTMEQIRQHNPPPNPAKLTDTRAKDYIKEHGHHSWEVDALDPATLDGIITEHIEANIDIEQYNLIKQEEEAEKEEIKRAIEGMK